MSHQDRFLSLSTLNSLSVVGFLVKHQRIFSGKKHWCRNWGMGETWDWVTVTKISLPLSLALIF